ncbi:MAG: long-chain N-acyl amino acid synthase [Pseudomonadota bacterium]
MLQDELPIASFESPSGLRDLCIREPAAEAGMEHPIDVQVFHIRMANSAGRREAASLLIRKMYGWRGYAVEPHEAADGNEARWPNGPKAAVEGKGSKEAGEPGEPRETNKITLYAETGGITVGTMSLCLDRDTSLPADENFRDKLDELRAQGRRLCEPSRLAIDKGVTKRVFASLIHISYIYAHNIHGFTDYIIEVNPRHVMFYKRMLGFSDFGGERPCTRVGAPAVLLRLQLDYMGEQIRRWGGLMEQHGDERSFYPYFFPTWDEPGITSRLKAGRN